MGHGAGFYVDATQAPWTRHFRMWSDVTEELPALIAEMAMTDFAKEAVIYHLAGWYLPVAETRHALEAELSCERLIRQLIVDPEDPIFGKAR